MKMLMTINMKPLQQKLPFVSLWRLMICDVGWSGWCEGRCNGSERQVHSAGDAIRLFPVHHQISCRKTMTSSSYIRHDSHLLYTVADCGTW